MLMSYNTHTPGEHCCAETVKRPSGQKRIQQRLGDPEGKCVQSRGTACASIFFSNFSWLGEQGPGGARSPAQPFCLTWMALCRAVCAQICSLRVQKLLSWHAAPFGAAILTCRNFLSFLLCSSLILVCFFPSYASPLLTSPHLTFLLSLLPSFRFPHSFIQSVMTFVETQEMETLLSSVEVQASLQDSGSWRYLWWALQMVLNLQSWPTTEVGGVYTFLLPSIILAFIIPSFIPMFFPS